MLRYGSMKKTANMETVFDTLNLQELLLDREVFNSSFVTVLT